MLIRHRLTDFRPARNELHLLHKVELVVTEIEMKSQAPNCSEEISGSLSGCAPSFQTVQTRTRTDGISFQQ